MAPMDKKKFGGVSCATETRDIKAVASLAMLTKVHAEGRAVANRDLLNAIQEHEAAFHAWMATAPGDGDLPVDTPEDRAAFEAETRFLFSPCRSEADIFAKIGYIYHRETAAAQDAYDAVVGREHDFLGFLGSLIDIEAVEAMPMGTTLAGHPWVKVRDDDRDRHAIDTLADALRSALTTWDLAEELTPAIEIAVDVTRSALLAYRPETLAGMHHKAAVMLSLRPFTNWDDLEREDLLRAFAMQCEGA
ncbi:hypothetical protein P9A16_31610 [Shinella sp. 838]|uniref:hypothetical protein n=1 Tax=Shinella sp. 838 TaxID=3038164 RepID=UPI0024157EEA|nr:hypothetical protein [Shinella sp. 838]MDG4675649.1 hypothetical protein [Shinella sp. 838]